MDGVQSNSSENCIRLCNLEIVILSSYIKLPIELDHPRKGLINIQNVDDNEFFKWSLVRYLNPANHHLAIITKADKDFAKRRDFKDIKLPVNIRNIHKSEKKKRFPSALVFLSMKIKKNVRSIYYIVILIYL